MTSQTKQAKTKRRNARIEAIDLMLKSLVKPMTTSEIVAATGFDKSRISFNLGTLLGSHVKREKLLWVALKNGFTSEEYDEYLVAKVHKKPVKTIEGARVVTIDDFADKRLAQSRINRAEMYSRGFGKIYIGCSFAMML